MPKDTNADAVASKENEVASARAAALLRDLGWAEARITRNVRKLRAEGP